MAFLHQNDEFNADSRPENITGIASDMVMHDSGSHSHQKKSTAVVCSLGLHDGCYAGKTAYSATIQIIVDSGRRGT